MYQSSITHSNPLSIKSSATLQPEPKSLGPPENKVELSPQRRKLPLGAIVSPLSPFFNERAKITALEQAKANSMEEGLMKLNKTAETNQSRFRSRSQSSESKDSEGGSSAYSSSCSSTSTSNDSVDSTQSFATAISLMDDDRFPQTLPRISYDEWSKLGISLFAPKRTNTHSKMYYHYPSLEKPKTTIPNHVQGNRPRSKSSVTPGVSTRPVRDEACRFQYSSYQSPGVASSTSPLSRGHTFASMRLPIERNHSSC